MIERILGEAVAAVDSTVDTPGSELYPAERAAVAKAVAGRQAEYATVRACARRAMERLGLPAAPVPVGEHGEPLWPAGVVGSMTHCTGYRAAALGLARDVRAIGIDAEPNAALKDGVLEAVSLPAERVWVRQLTDSHPGVAWDRLLFSAKEAVYKAWFPLTRRRLDFDQALITVDRARGTFEARLLVPGPMTGPVTGPVPDPVPGPGDGPGPTVLPGRWLAHGGLVLTAVALPAA
ncbi:4'-phosphopantetheinyl transferase [Kitasatospora sp. NPDC096147]|uniref:4'-phosphopantetheinyl transferase family protein n=1 Tax=Kitasatospora sp. NPDC096147 TaxID=3364093 RepID=UPI0037F1ABC2